MRRLDGLENNLKKTEDHMGASFKRLDTLEDATGRIDDLESNTKRLDIVENALERIS